MKWCILLNICNTGDCKYRHFQALLIKNDLINRGYWCMMKSSVDPEVVLEGRPYGGLGFICKKLPGISYLTVNSENDRIGVLQILSNHKVILTINWCIHALL